MEGQPLALSDAASLVRQSVIVTREQKRTTMQLQHVVVVAAAVLLASSDGLQVVPNSAKSTSLRAPAETRYQPYVEGKTDRFLITEAKNDAVTKASTGYEFSTLQEEDNDVLQEEEEYEDSESSSADGSGEDERLFGRKKKRRKRKKNKATETPTPTPTATPAGNATATPEPGTPAPTTEEPEGVNAFVAWFNRRFGD